MLIRSHRDLLPEEIVGDAVVRDIAEHEEVFAADGLHDHALAVAVGETGAGGVDDEGILAEGISDILGFIPFDQPFVYEFGEFARPGSRDKSERGFGTVFLKR